MPWKAKELMNHGSLCLVAACTVVIQSVKAQSIGHPFTRQPLPFGHTWERVASLLIVVGFPGLFPEDIKQFDHYPVLIEARLSKEGLLSFESILEESLVSCMESVMNGRVKCFESLVENWGPKSIQATEGFKVYSSEQGEMVPSVTTFNVPLLESIASGHIFDRTFASPSENIEKMRKDNDRCMELLTNWLNQFPKGFSNPNLKISRNGEGLTGEFLSKPRKGVLGPGTFARHPDLHSTSYQLTDPNDIRLILPVRGILPMGCAKGVVGYGMIHPNLINAAVLQCHGMTARSGHFDAMSLAPNFDLLLKQGQATEVARLIALWNDQTVELGEQGNLIVQPPLEPTKENMKFHWDCINPMQRTQAAMIHMSDVPGVVAPNVELSWLIPIMAPILQNQGTNIRALLYHLKCQSDNYWSHRGPVVGADVLRGDCLPRSRKARRKRDYHRQRQGRKESPDM